MKVLSLFVTLWVICAAESYKILVVFPWQAQSHYILGSTLARGLAEAGHDVTLVSPYALKNPPKNCKYRDVVLNLSKEILEGERNFDFLQLSSMSPFENIPLMTYKGYALTDYTLRDDNLQKLINSGERFDAVIIEQFYNEGLKALATHFDAHLIIFNTQGINVFINSLVGNPSPPSYIPNFMIGYTSSMSFLERTYNLLLNTAEELIKHWIHYNFQEYLSRKYISANIDFKQAIYNVSLILANSHESTHIAVPSVPNIIQIGGFHITPPKKLPKELQKFIDSAQYGVVYFSLGSNIKPSTMSNTTKQNIISSLSKLKQKVLWKWDENILHEQPENVRISKWFPQQDILAHPNVKLFITHGGALSTTETVYHGVPVLVLPVFADQKLNGRNAEIAGYCISIPYAEITEEKLSVALNKLLNDPNYSENVKIRSKLLKDRQIKPMDVAIYWIEYVIRNKGASHLRVAGINLPWYKYLMLDVIGFLFIVLLLIFYLLYKLSMYFITNGKKKLKTN